MGKKFIFHLADTSSISATIAQRSLSFKTTKFPPSPVVEVFYTDAASSGSISCAAVTIQEKNGQPVRAWEGRVIGPKPADHVERFEKPKSDQGDRPRPSPVPSLPQPAPTPPNHELFTHYHVSIALGFGFFFGLVAGIVLDRPFYGHYYHHH